MEKATIENIPYNAYTPQPMRERERRETIRERKGWREARNGERGERLCSLNAETASLT